ncbi:HIT-like protein [Planctomycetes bacterium Pla163]|jgi:histidine triad (HIT) family protein|uniref:HIT-like protein n=1 Tax=Rohdeia mirabilis TaxID=2528008 RepID=A0A518CWG1_9BACT|nr:HIT-like protein [Planctomycetes bacterium Pla163]
MATIFDKILSGEIPCHRVWEDDEHLAFLDIQPRVPGHTLVIPKRPTDYLFDLDDASTAKLWIATKKVATLLKERLDCGRVCVSVVGWEVRHVHVHLFPTNSIADVGLGPIDQAAVAGLTEMGRRLAP